MRVVAPSINPPSRPEVATSDYLHQARRLRRLYSHNPTLLHQRLRHLSKTLTPPTPKPTYSSDSPVAHHFAERVAARLPRNSNLLSYSSRLRLLQEAQGLGISRFEANLIIAITQHRHAPAVSIDRPSRPSSRGSLLVPLSAALTLQAVLLTLAWYTLAR